MRKIGLMVLIIMLGIFSVFLVSFVSGDNQTADTDLCPDLNEDGILSQTDFDIFVRDYIPGEVTLTNAGDDLNKDGVINFGDYVLFLQNYEVGKVCPVAPVIPEEPEADLDCVDIANGVQEGNCSAEGNYCSSGSCCGDDLNEHFVYQKAGTSSYIENKLSKGICYIQEAEPNFCLFSDDGKRPGSYVGSVDNTQYKYSNGAIAGSIVGNIWRGAICNAGSWDELCDVNENACNAGCGLQWQTQSTWVDDGDFCCGDDLFEFNTEGSDGTSACCVGSNYFVKNGICYNKVHDVSVEEIVVPSNASTDDEIEIKAKVSNLGDYDENVSVGFSIENETGGLVYETEKEINLNMNDTEEVSFFWKAVEGFHNLIARVFVNGDFDESNNEATGVINISAAVEEPEPAECSMSEIKCAGTNYFTCVSDEWSNKGEVPGKCGVEIPTSCEDTDGGLDYSVAGNAKLKLNGKYKGYMDTCKAKETTNLGDVLNNIWPGGGPGVFNEVTPYLYEAYCKDGGLSIKIKKCDCFNGACI